MRKIILIFLPIILLSFLVAAQERRNAVQWEALKGWNHPTVKAYIDTKSVRYNSEVRQGFGIILFVSFARREIDNGKGGKVMSNTIARYLIADCKSALVAPISEFYFDLNHLPDLTDKPVGGLNYSADELDAKSISKSSPIYQALCPIQL